MNRRLFLRNTFLAALAAGLAPGLLIPVRALGAWPQQAFLSEDAETAVRAVLGDAQIQPSAAIMLEAPQNAENGALVRISIETDLEDAETLTLISEPNPFPLIARFHLTPRLRGPIVTRIRMGGSGDVVAIVGQGGRYYSARRPVRVAVGGC
jgi:sulfur-oxidizing protein SoxY